LSPPSHTKVTSTGRSQFVAARATRRRRSATTRSTRSTRSCAGSIAAPTRRRQGPTDSSS